MGLEGTLYATMWIGFMWLMILHRLETVMKYDESCIALTLFVL